MLTPFAPKALIVVEIDESGQVIQALQSSDNRVTGISDFELVDQTYYFGSPFNNYLGRLKTRIPIRVKLSDITAPPPVEQPKPTKAPTTKPPATKPAATKPPTTVPPTTRAPPTTQAPTTKPPTTKPPTTKAPTTQPPSTKPPTTKAPTTQKPATNQKPVTQKPVTQKPVHKQHNELWKSCYVLIISMMFWGCGNKIDVLYYLLLRRARNVMIISSNHVPLLLLEVCVNITQNSLLTPAAEPI